MSNGSNDWGVSFGRISFLDGILRGHGNVASIVRDQDILFKVARKNQSDVLRILCCDEYAMGTTLVNRALAEFGSLNIIFVGGAWHGYTKQAKDQCLAAEIGLYNATELAGGLWRNDYWAYNRQDEDGNPVFAYKTAGS
jgi:hypothetical protein